MRWNLWLAQPETERSLGMMLRVAVTVVALWTLAAAYSLWSTRMALAAAQLSVLTQSNQMLQVARDLPEKRRQALKATEVKMISSHGAGSAEIMEELAELAQTAGAQVRGVRISNGGQSSSTPVAPAPTEANANASAGAASTPATQADDQSHETFECNITGEYQALTRFLNELAASRHVLDITSLQVSNDNAKHATDAPRLEMKISGTVYETSEK